MRGRATERGSGEKRDRQDTRERSEMPKRKCNFTEDLRKKYPCFRPGRDKWEAECTVCKAGTYVSVANKGANDLQAHIDTIKGPTIYKPISTL